MSVMSSDWHGPKIVLYCHVKRYFQLISNNMTIIRKQGRSSFLGKGGGQLTHVRHLSLHAVIPRSGLPIDQHRSLLI